MTREDTLHPADLLPAFALGALDGDDLSQVESHLATGCAVCTATLRSLADDLEWLSLSAPAGDAAIAASLKPQLMAKLTSPSPRLISSRRPTQTIQTTTQLEPPARLSPPATPATPATAANRRAWMAIAALLLLSFWGITRLSSLDAQLKSLRRENHQLEARAAELQLRASQATAQADYLGRALSIISAPGMRSVELAGMGTSHSAVGRTYVNVAQRLAVFHGYHLASLPADKTYQLWFVNDDDENVSAGTFLVDARGEASLTVDRPLPVDRIQGWVVTIEPRGGRQKPTGPIALAG